MADTMEFDRYAQPPDLDAMKRDELLDCLETVQARIAQLDEQEPADMSGEDYEAWGDRHEALEDLADEIRDRLDELG